MSQTPEPNRRGGGGPRGSGGRSGSRPDNRGGRPGQRNEGGRGGDREADAEAAALNALRQKLSGLLRRLPDVERRVLELRMGLVDGNPAKPGEVADRLGLTIPEVKKIEQRAFSRIREVGPIKGLERFLGKPS